MQRASSLEKTLMLGKIEGKSKREQQRLRWLDSTTDSVHFSHSSCLTLCDPMDCSTQGFPVHNQLPEHAQTHVHPDGH